jgi:hypothetical protein
LRIV